MVVRVRPSMHQRLKLWLATYSLDVPTFINDEQPTDKETGTSVSDNPKYGIISIDVPSRGEDVRPLPPQPMLEPKDESIEFDVEVISPLVFPDVILKERTTRKRGIPWKL
uniref:Uncharacterized protein n=1 Tax=Cucumis sativus TaxID=3659 RepID=A0A0A0L860_CUCSA